MGVAGCAACVMHKQNTAYLRTTECSIGMREAGGKREGKRKRKEGKEVVQEGAD